MPYRRNKAESWADFAPLPVEEQVEVDLFALAGAGCTDCEDPADNDLSNDADDPLVAALGEIVEEEKPWEGDADDAAEAEDNEIEAAEEIIDAAFDRQIQNSTVKELREGILTGDLELEAVLAAEARGRGRAGVQALANELS